MKLFDLRRRGCAWTLGYVVGVDTEDFTVLCDITTYLQIPYDSDDDARRQIELPVTFPIESRGEYYDDTVVENMFNTAVRLGYCTVSDGRCTLTQKAFDVFQKTLDRDKELQTKSFHYCPCTAR